MSSLQHGSLVTFDRSHPDFEKYILGSFSHTFRAIPVRSLNVNTGQEQVTFEIQEVAKIHRPAFWVRGLTIVKAKNFVLVLFPLFLVLVKNIIDETLGDVFLAAFAALAALSAHVAVNLMNDVQDHVRGLDRLLPRAGSRALQKGWTTALVLQRAAAFYLLLAVVFGLPSFYFFPEILWTILPLALIGIAGLLSYKAGLKYRAWSEWVVFLMLGPLLTTGYQLSFGGGFDLEVVFIGVLTGWLSVFLLHLKNWDQLVVNSQAGFNNSVSRFGFEKSKKFIQFWWCSFVILLVIYHSIYSTPGWLWLMAAAGVTVTIPFLRMMKSVESPLGSKIHGAVQIGQRVLVFMCALWFFENLWTYFIADFLG